MTADVAGRAAEVADTGRSPPLHAVTAAPAGEAAGIDPAHVFS